MVVMDEVEEMESSGGEHEEQEDDEDFGDMFPDGDESSKRKLSDNEESEEDTKNLSGKKKRKLRKENEMKKLNKPPTVEELNRLRETENLFHSNLFRRQIEEMLKELELKNKNRVRINTWFEKFKEWVLKSEDADQNYDLGDIQWIKDKKMKPPIPNFGTSSKGHYCFKKPQSIKLIGSYVSKTMLGPGTVDITIEMPPSFFEKEDYLNGRYYKKRAIYLSELATHILAMKELTQDAKFLAHDGDNLRPLLEITPSGKLSKNFKFLIHVVPVNTSFRLNRFIPTRNNVRCRWFLGQDSEINDKDCPTPDYNNGVLRDLRCPEDNEYVAEALAQNPQLRDAVVLLKVWARQRELHLGYGGFTGFFWSMLIAYLVRIRKLATVTSSYKVVRTVWNYLVSADWSKNGITLCDTTAQLQPEMTDFHEKFPLVFVDPSGFLNICAGMDLTLFQRCQDEAGLAIQSLDTPDINCFQVLFMTPAPFTRLCDHGISFHDWSSLGRLVANHSDEKTKINYCGLIYPQAKNVLIAILKRGLGERARRFFVRQNAPKTWSVNKKPSDSGQIAFGVILDPEHCFSLVDKGPIDDPEKSQEFREFWGKRSDLRRFKDGSITESVVWDAKTWQDKRMICRQIVSYLIESKLGMSSSAYHYVGDELESVLPKNREPQTTAVLAALDNLIKTLRSLTDLPLNLISVQGASAVFRSSDVFPPALVKDLKKCTVDGKCAKVNPDVFYAPEWCPTAEVILQLGSSNKWPRDLDAVRRVRAAFNLKISELLSEQSKIISQPYQNWVDVLTDKCIFRLRIIYPGEIALMKKGTTPDGVVLYRDTEESLILEKKGIHLPKLTSALSGVQSQFSAYGTACCIAKRWVRSHLFQPEHISDEALDLIVASVFVNPDPWRPPNQPQTAFLRFLSLIAHTNWNMEFILLNFNQVLTGDEKHEIESHFDNQRSSLPCMFIATPDDRTRSVWTRDGPDPVVLLRLCQLAKKTLEILEEQLFHNPKPEIMPVFQPTFNVFDVVINLVAGFVPKHHQSLSAMKDVEMKGADDLSVIPVVDFDPVQCYLSILRESYQEWVLFFYDTYGGSTIGVIWKPGAQQSREFKVSHLHGRRWEKKTNTLHLNTDAILEGFYTCGQGIVKSIQIKKDDRLVPIHF